MARSVSSGRRVERSFEHSCRATASRAVHRQRCAPHATRGSPHGGRRCSQRSRREQRPSLGTEHAGAGPQWLILCDKHRARADIGPRGHTRANTGSPARYMFAPDRDARAYRDRRDRNDDVSRSGPNGSTPSVVVMSFIPSTCTRRSPRAARPLRPISSSVSRVSRLLIALSMSHCTLTSDTYAPNPLGDTETDTGRLEGGDGSAPPASAPPAEPSETPEAPPSTERGPSPVNLDPSDPETDLGSGASSGSNGNDAASDAGSDSADAGAPVPAEPTEPEPTEPEPEEPQPTEPEPTEPEPEEPQPTEPIPVDTCPGSELGGSC